MKGWGILIVVSLFLTGFVAASFLTGSTVDNTSGTVTEQYVPISGSVVSAVGARDSVTNKNLTDEQIKNIVLARNKLRFENRTTIPCPTSCTCAGSTMKCTLLGNREMTVTAGNSGNVIVQVKGENMSTNVMLYKSSDGKLYGIFKNNETKRVRMLPDQVKDRIREKLQKQIENENITLDENGTYLYTGQKKARLFLIFPVRVAVQARINSETGNVTILKVGKWWSFLAKDEAAEQLVGASCGTVTPGSNDACCQTKGYDIWNVTTSQCEFTQ